VELLGLPAKPVNDDVGRPDKPGPDHLQPTVTVSVKGVVGVSWYDRREDAANRGWRARFAATIDGGVTFLPSIAVSDASYDPAKTRPTSVNEIVEKAARLGTRA